MRIFILGDVHGNSLWTTRQIERAYEYDCDRVVVVGDVGYGFPHYTRFFDSIEKACSENNVDFYWLRGNHDRPSVNDDYNVYDGFVQMLPNYPHIYFITDGYRWEWDGVSFVALGGAVSIDKHLRKPGVSWWESETTTESSVQKTIEAGKTDVLLTHDAPLPVLDVLGLEPLRDITLYAECKYNQELLQQAAQEIKPSIWLHGHFHEYCNYEWRGINVIGLACDGMDRSSYILDLDGF